MAAPTPVEIAANGLRFETLLDGPSDGEPVILLHGYPQSAGSWAQTMEWLVDRGHRVLAPNLRGYSPGANPPEASAYRMSTLVDDVLGIADAQGADRFHLVGHDWGGALAWAVAAGQPGRLLSLTSVSTPHPLAMRDAMRSSLQAVRSGYMAFFCLPRIPEALLQAGDFAQLGLSVRLFGLPAAVWERDRAQLRRVGLRGPLNWYRGATGGLRLGPVSVPTLFAWGRHDPFLGRHAAEGTAEHVSGPYRFEELDAGHWIPDRNAAELEQVLAAHLEENGQAVAQTEALPRAPRARTPRRRPARA